MQKGKAILPAEAGMLAILAKSFIFVYQRPRVSILSTGDELADLDERFNEEKIVNSNSYAIAAQVKEAGGLPVLPGLPTDKTPNLKEAKQGRPDPRILRLSPRRSIGCYPFPPPVFQGIRR